jgi:hypothetical protein
MNVGDTIDLISTWSATDPLLYPTVSRTLTDPTALTCVVTAPDLTTTTYTYPATITRTSLGVFYVRIVVSQAGTWTAAWTGTGAAAGVERKSFLVAT